MGHVFSPHFWSCVSQPALSNLVCTKTHLNMHQNAPALCVVGVVVCVYVCVVCVIVCVFVCVIVCECVRWLNAMIRELAETFNENSTFEC